MPKEETKQIIEAAAFKVFMQKGFANTSMSELVKVAGVSKGAFYHYFNSKESLYFAVLDRYFLNFYREMDWSHAKGMQPEALEQQIDEAYHQFFNHLLEMTENNISRYYIMFFEAFEFHPNFKKEVQTFYLNLQKVILCLRGHEMDIPRLLIIMVIHPKTTSISHFLSIFKCELTPAPSQL